MLVYSRVFKSGRLSLVVFLPSGKRPAWIAGNELCYAIKDALSVTPLHTSFKIRGGMCRITSNYQSPNLNAHSIGMLGMSNVPHPGKRTRR